MNRSMASSLFVALALTLVCGLSHAKPVVELRPDDHICLVGNGLGESLQHHPDWETLLHTRFPKHRLVVRNLCVAADTPQLRPRSMDFGSPDEHLSHSQASVILFFFGGNEAFHGDEGTEDFRAQLQQLLVHTQEQKYDGQAAPRIVLVSPIAHEDLRDPNLPNGRQHNEQLKQYTQLMREVAAAHNVGFVDVFTPTLKQMQDPVRWTSNGIHLNKFGHQNFAPILDQALFGEPPSEVSVTANLRDAVAEKNFQWWHRYRAVNGFYIYGDRSKLTFEPDKSFTNADVMERERQILDVMTANRDQRIWDIAQGNQVPSEIDDSNTPEFYDVVTNFNLEQQGKTGQLTYLSPTESVAQFEIADGYQIECFASEQEFPELANAVQFAFDAKGRLWVACMPSYPQYLPKQEINDKVVILEDVDQDGQADKCTVFADGLHVPTGIELGDGGAYVAEQPDLLFLKDTDGDDRADVRVRRLRGFDSADSHHSISAFTWGPGGSLYFQEGTFHHSQIETPYGAVRVKDAAVFRYDPRQENLDVFVSYRFNNPWGHIFDRWGQNFVADASDGANYFGTAFSGHVEYGRKHPRMQQFLEKRFRPTAGCEFVSSRHFPDSVQGNFLLNNCIGEQGVYQHTMEEVDSGFVATEIEPLLRSKDRNFRPVDLEFGPDGALYICDWQNALVGHMQHSIRDPSRDQKHGRIWRITYPGRPLLQPAKIDGQPIGELVKLLAAYEDRTRYRVRRELRKHETSDVIQTVNAWLSELDESNATSAHHQLEALWIHQQHNRVNTALLEKLLTSPEPRARAAATRVVCYWRDQLESPLKLLARSATDTHPRVRLEAVRACSFFTGENASEAAEVALASLEHPTDYYLDYTLKETMDTLDPYLQ